MSEDASLTSNPKKYWEEVGLLLIFDNNGNTIIGKVMDVTQNVLIVLDLAGLRHWINVDSVTRIMELGRPQT